jgi:hypothetical protein
MILFMVLMLIFRINVHTVMENVESLVFASKQIGVEVNADKTQYMVIYRD